MIIYVDFDGIIVDTWPVIVQKYKECYETDNIEEVKLRKLFERLDWDEILDVSYKNEINIETLKHGDNMNIKILSKVNTDDEARAKQDFLAKLNLGIELITVPIDIPKNEVVESEGNTLIDDDLKNVEAWEKSGGCGILYSKNNDGKDSDGNVNVKYECISLLTSKYIEELQKM